MKNTYLPIAFLSMALLLSNCVNYQEEIQLSPEWYRIDMSNPIPGQTSFYERFTGCNDRFELSGDTLKVQVIEKEGVIFLRESFTKHSPGRAYDWGRKKVEYPFYSVKNKLYMPKREESQLFWFYASDYLHLKPEEAIPMRQNSCVVNIGDEIFTGNEIGFIDKFEIGHYRLENMHVVSCVPDYLYSYLFHDHKELKMSVFFSAFGRQGYSLINAELPSTSYLERMRRD